MKIHCLLRTAKFRGERSDPVAEAVTVEPGETVAALAQRLLSIADVISSHDWIELRVEPEAGERRGGH